jgi:hypothetical protein
VAGAPLTRFTLATYVLLPDDLPGAAFLGRLRNPNVVCEPKLDLALVRARCRRVLGGRDRLGQEATLLREGAQDTFLDMSVEERGANARPCGSEALGVAAGAVVHGIALAALLARVAGDLERVPAAGTAGEPAQHRLRGDRAIALLEERLLHRLGSIEFWTPQLPAVASVRELGAEAMPPLSTTGRYGMKSNEGAESMRLKNEPPV